MDEIEEVLVVTDEAGNVVAVEEVELIDGDEVLEQIVAVVDEDGAIETVDLETEAEAGADAKAAGQGETRRASDETDELDNEGDVAADYLEELLDIADLDGDIDTYTEGDRAHVSIVTDSDQLVGKGGTVLDALQDLTRLAVLTQTGRHSRLMLDVAGFREKRRTELRQLALDAVNEVKASGEAVRLAPMNPFERKIVHDTVAANGLTSESEGAEPQRRVVISPVD